MPNGGNWDRFWFTVVGFNVAHGRWPTRVRAPSIVLEQVEAHLGPADHTRLLEKLQLVEGAELVAEDDAGARYEYQGPPAGAPTESVEAAFGVRWD
jgi:hypothetical protein